MFWHRSSAVRSCVRLAFAALTATCCTVSAFAQVPAGSAYPQPRLFTVFPPGAKAGTTVEVNWTGTDLEEPEALLFSHPAVKAEPILPPPPPPPDPKKPATPPPPPTPVTKFKVTVPPEVPPGFLDVRLVNKWGVSNPRTFVVGDLEEVLEKEPNDNDAQPQKVPLNTTINGTSQSNVDVDYYSFAGMKGQRVVFSCLALSIDSRLQPNIEVYDAAGRQLAANHLYGGGRHHATNDALTDVVLPADGDYTVRIAPFTYFQGNPEFFYRLTISTTPWIDAVHPCVVEPGKPTKVTLYGRNLPGGQPDPASVLDGRVLEKLVVDVTPPNDPLQLAFSGRVDPTAAGLDGFEYRIRNAVGVSNPVLLTLAQAPVAIDNENNDTAETAQDVPFPVEIAGRVEKKRDRDWYAFTLKKGDVLNFEVIGDRLGSPSDLYLVLHNPATKANLVEVDDNPDTLSLKLYARTDDPAVYRFVAPADGKYLLLVTGREADNQADPRHVYRVRVTPDRPDFRLFLMPADGYRPDGVTLLQGASEALTVLAIRQDGMNADIALSVEGLPTGVTAIPQSLGRKLKQTTIALTAEANAPVFTGAIRVKGTAIINGQPVVREARSAVVTWPVQPQANIPTVSRLARGTFLAVRGPAPFGLSATVDKAAVVQGDKATIAVKINRISPDIKQPVAVAVYDPTPTVTPQNLVITAGNIAPNANDASLAVTVNANVEPGVYTVLLRGTTQLPFNKDPKAAQKPAINIVLPSTPLTLTVLPKVVATVTAAVPTPTVKLGTQTEVVVRVARMYDYTGPFQLELVTPQNVPGFTIDPVTIPQGADEAKVIVKVAENAPVGNRPDLAIRATAMVNGNVPTVQESAKFAINVVK